MSEQRPLQAGDVVEFNSYPASWGQFKPERAMVAFPGTLSNTPEVYTLYKPASGKEVLQRWNLQEKYLKRVENDAWKKGLLEGALKSSENFQTILNSTGVCSGTDPEIFVVDEHDHVLPAYRWLPAKKEATKQWKDGGMSPYRGPVFWDGFQAEFLPNPAHCLQQVMEFVRNGLVDVHTLARNFDNKARLSIKSEVEVPLTLRMSEKIEHLAFLCSPSYNVYSELQPELPDARSHAWRYAGGHIHMGIALSKDTLVINNLVKKLDAILGVAGVSLAASLDTPQRRKLYGKAGEFRLPKHGLEYRVLSNFWLCSPVIFQLTFMLARAAAKLAMSPLSKYWEADEDHVRSVINGCDVQGARTIIAHNLPVLQSMVAGMRFWPSSDQTRHKLFIETMLHGVEHVVKDPTDVEGNWCIGGKGAAWQQHGAQLNGAWGSVEIPLSKK